MKPSFQKRIFFISTFILAAVFCFIFLRVLPADSPVIFINEVCTANVSVTQDSNGKFRNYVELYNAGSEDADLSDLYLSNKRKHPKKFALKGVTVPAHGYVLIFFGGKNTETSRTAERDEIVSEQEEREQAVEPGSYTYPIDDTGLHMASTNEANFDYDIDGGDLFLTGGNVRTNEHVRIPALDVNTSYCRVTDGSRDWHVATCTPGMSNETASETRKISLEEPQFSAESGFYDSPFTLRLSAEAGAQIYYTLDGSDPSPEGTASILYTDDLNSSNSSLPAQTADQVDGSSKVGQSSQNTQTEEAGKTSDIDQPGIWISDPSAEPNQYASRTDITVPANYTPDGPVDKARVVKAVAYDPATNTRSRIVARTYFVGFQNKAAYKDIPVVSIATDPSNLFDYNHGIYTTGVTYEEYLKIGGFENWDPEDVPSHFYQDDEGRIYIPDATDAQEEAGAENGNNLIDSAAFHREAEDEDEEIHEYWRYQYSNAMEGGRTWERGGSISYFDENHELQFTQNIGLRIAGESSRSALQKSLNIYARKAYDTSGNGKFDYPFFYQGEIDKFRLRKTDNSGLSRDSFLMLLAEDRNVAIQRSYPVAVFLDGEYWGIYYLKEQYRKEYFEHYFNVDPSDVWLLKNMEVDMGSSDAAHDYDVMVQQITQMDMADPVQFGVVDHYINLDSLIDWYCLNLYADNEDVGSDRNISVWRTGTDEGSEPGNAKWNYLLYDMDVTVGTNGSASDGLSIQSGSGTHLSVMGSSSEPWAANTFAYYRKRDDTFYLPGWLCTNEEFRQKYCTAMMDIANTTYSYHRVHAMLKNLQERIQDQCADSVYRFETSDNPAAVFIQDYNEINDFFRYRRAYIEQYLREDQKLTGDVVPVTVKVTNRAGGSIRVNTTTLNEDEMTNSWTGDYFSDFDITVTASPKEGYHFSGWKITQNGKSSDSSNADLRVDLTGGAVTLQAVFEED